MNYAEICIIKRDGKREDFSISKIKNAISKAFSATGIQDEQQLIADITMNVISQFATPTITVEEIQDLVEKALMKVRPEVAKKYIIYREWRNTERDKKTQMKHVMDGIVAIDKNDVNLSNANMSSHTPAGQMMTFASEVTKDYTYKYLLPKRLPKLTNWETFIFMTWIIIRQKRRLVSNMTWMICSNAVSVPKTAVSAPHKAFKVMQLWLRSSSRQTRTSSTADRQFPPSTFSWQRVWPSHSASIYLLSSISMWPWKTVYRPMKKRSAH